MAENLKFQLTIMFCAFKAVSHFLSVCPYVLTGPVASEKHCLLLESKRLA